MKTDDKGMIGRECPSEDCGLYFKLKLGTGLPIQVTRCPYCETEAEMVEFFTRDQLQFIKSVVAKEIVEPAAREFAQNIEQLNRNQPDSLIRFGFSVRYEIMPPHEYMEEQLETEISCDQCGLEFAIYGVFSTCPDCGQLNALSVCLASLETAKKKLKLSQDQNLDDDLKSDFLRDALVGAVGAFDAFGKALRSRRTGFRSKARSNLFQAIEALDAELQVMDIPRIKELVGVNAWEELKWFFQARHIYNHNAGVVDNRFAAKQPAVAHMVGRILPLETDRLRINIETLGRLAKELDARIR